MNTGNSCRFRIVCYELCARLFCGPFPLLLCATVLNNELSLSRTRTWSKNKVMPPFFGGVRFGARSPRIRKRLDSKAISACPLSWQMYRIFLHTIHLFASPELGLRLRLKAMLGGSAVVSQGLRCPRTDLASLASLVLRGPGALRSRLCAPTPPFLQIQPSKAC